MTSSRYAEALASTLVWLEIDRGGWGAVISPPSEQRELASYLSNQWPDRPVIELGASATPEWFVDAVQAAASGDVPGAFVVLAPDLDELSRKHLLVMLNGQRDRTSNHGVWLLIISPRELEQVRRHAPDLASVFSSFEIVKFIPRAMTDDEVRAARSELHAYYRRRFGRLDLRGFVRSEQEDASFHVEAIFQHLRARVTPDERVIDRWPELPLPVRSTMLEQIESLRETPPTPALIVGGPGSGKSFFLRWCAMAGARDEQFLGIVHAIPAYVPLAALRLSATADDLAQHVVEGLLEAGLRIGHAFDSEAQQGRVLFLLDGLDEVGRSTDAVVAAVAKLRRRFSTAAILVTSRPAGLAPLPFVVDRFDLEGLDDDAIRRLLTTWCELYETQRVGQGGAARGRVEGSRLADQVIGSTTLQELARSPLMATIIAIVHRAGVRLPDHRVELYEHIMRILVERWNQVRSRESESAGLSIRASDAIRLLGPVAYEMVVAGRDGAIDEDSLRALVARQLQRGTVRVIASADEAIGIFRDSLGLLVEQSPGIYGFLHKTLGEFLAAHDVVRTGALERLLAPENCFDPRWREVLLLAFGIVGTLQANDERLGAAVDRLLESARASRGSLTYQVPLLLGGVVIDDPALSPEQATSLCAEVVTIFSEAHHEGVAPGLFYQACAVALDVLSGSWRATMENQLRVRYTHGAVHRLVRRISVPDHLMRRNVLREIGVSALVLDCEFLVARLADLDGEHGLTWAQALLVGRLSPDGLVRLQPSDDSPVELLIRHGASGLIEIRTAFSRNVPPTPSPYELRDGRLMVRTAGRKPVQARASYVLPSGRERRRALIPRVLAAWREIADKNPEGPQPPASVEEAIAKYGPPAQEA